jgi:hypothetical protein
MVNVMLRWEEKGDGCGDEEDARAVNSLKCHQPAHTQICLSTTKQQRKQLDGRSWGNKPYKKPAHRIDPAIMAALSRSYSPIRKHIL